MELIQAMTQGNIFWYEFLNVLSILNQLYCSTKHATMNGTIILPGYVILPFPEHDEKIKFGEIKSIVTTEEKRYYYAFMNVKHWDTKPIFIAGKLKKLVQKK